MEKRPLNIQLLFNMCVNKRYVLNPYIHKRILVDCGKCEACQQERAIMRTNRIRNEYDSNYIMLFGTHNSTFLLTGFTFTTINKYSFVNIRV